MKNMNRHLLQSISAICLISSFSLASCSRIEDIPGEEPEIQQPAETVIHFTATLAPKGEDPMTKAITSGTDAGKEVLNVVWAEDEQVAVYYQKTDDTYATATATVGTPTVDGSAPITATLIDAKDGSAVEFVYPATLHDGSGGINASAMASQHGTIADISANFDAATASATLQTDGTTCSTTATINFTNQVLIGKFMPKYSGTPIDGITTLTVSDGTRTYTVTPTAGTFGTDGIYVAMLPVSDLVVKLLAITDSQNYYYPGKTISLAVGKFYRNLAMDMNKGVELSLLAVNCTMHNGETLTGTLDGATQKVKVSIADGATVTLSDATINGVHTNDIECLWAGITCLGDATIVLADGTTNTVMNFNRSYPAIHAAVGKTLVIKGGLAGTGKLIANSSYFGAAIGGGDEIDCGNIEIQGGDITANGGSGSAAIGSGTDASCGNITISGGSVTATARDDCAGIGSGFACTVDTSCGDISISGSATVIATGGRNAAGIGSGSVFSNRSFSNVCGDISISGSVTVTTTGGDNAAGIGTGRYAKCGAISITGGTIRALGGENGAGIGCGMGYSESKSECGNITIMSGEGFTSVTAIKGEGLATSRPIGHSHLSATKNICGTIIFGNNVVYSAGDNPGVYNIGADNLHLEQTTTVPDGENNNDHRYDNNTWTLTP